MTERSRSALTRSASALSIGPSALSWNGRWLDIEIDEMANPLPRHVKGRVRVHPPGLSRFHVALDAAGRHRWGPISACARVEVEMQSPALRWQGSAYFDSNEGDEPITTPFERWDWLRAPLADGSTAVVYDVQPKLGPERVIAARFLPDGRAEPFEAAPRRALPRSSWLVARASRSDAAAAAPRVLRTLEDTPFYARSLIDATLCGERVVAMHESISLPRLDSTAVRMLLPWRMPRRG